MLENVNGKVPKKVKAAGNTETAKILKPIPGDSNIKNNPRPTVNVIILLGCPPSKRWANS